MDLKDRYFTVLDSLPDHIFVFSESGVYIDVYGGDENATGFDCKAFIGLSLYDVAPSNMATKFHTYIKAALNTNEIQIVRYKFDQEEMMDLPAHIPPLQEMWFEGIIKPLPLMSNGERTVVWMAKNVTERYLLEKRLKELSEIDELTNIYNRRSFTTALSEALKEYHLCQRHFSLLMFDIDRFKQINDSVGHTCGDDVIKHVVNTFQSGLRDSDCLGRIGGEEFAIIVKDTKLNDAEQLANKLRKKLESEHCDTENYQVKVTVSIGVTQVEKTDDEIKNILSRADKAMYYSKAKGRNTVTVYSDIIEQHNQPPLAGAGITLKPGSI